MYFPAIKKSELLSFIDYCYNRKKYLVQIILRNGQIIVGCIRQQRYEFLVEEGFNNHKEKELLSLIPSSEECFRGDALVLTILNHAIITTEQKSFCLQLDVIAGITVIDYVQKPIREASHEVEYPCIKVVVERELLIQSKQLLIDKTVSSFNNANTNNMARDLLLTFEKYNIVNPVYKNSKLLFTINDYPVYSYHDNHDYQMHDDKQDCLYAHYHEHHSVLVNEIRWGRAEPQDNIYLYADWEYINRVKYGVNSIGIGIPYASFSIGWESSLWKELSIMVNKNRLIPLDEIQNQSSGIIEGHINFQKAVNRTLNRTDIQYVEMEGSKWLPAIISDDTYDKQQKVNWGVVYFRNEGLMLPVDAWPAFDSKVTIFGEFIPVPIKTSFGDTKYFIKARAAILFKNI